MLAPRECIHPRPPHRVCGHESLITRPRASRSFIISRQRLPRGHSNDYIHYARVCLQVSPWQGDIRGCARHGRYGYANIGIRADILYVYSATYGYANIGIRADILYVYSAKYG